jgi:endonuclease-3
MEGIGVKTAACVFLFSLGRDVFPIDTHIHRILNRIGVVDTRMPEKTFFEMRQKVPKGSAYSLHVNLIRLGRTICRPRNPRCCQCPVEHFCSYGMKEISDDKT